MDVLAPLSKILDWNQVVLDMTDRCSKLTRFIQTSTTTMSHNKSLLIDYCIILNGIATHVLTDSTTQVIATFFEALSPSWESKATKNVT